MNRSTRSLVRAALIAAIYCLLTIIFQPISFGAVQFRISEALTLLPVLMPEAVPGLFKNAVMGFRQKRRRPAAGICLLSGGKHMDECGKI